MTRTAYLSDDQKKAVEAYWSGPPRTLLSDLDPADFPREIDVYLWDVKPGHARRT